MGFSWGSWTSINDYLQVGVMTGGGNPQGLLEALLLVTALLRNSQSRLPLSGAVS